MSIVWKQFTVSLRLSMCLFTLVRKHKQTTLYSAIMAAIFGLCMTKSLLNSCFLFVSCLLPSILACPFIYHDILSFVASIKSDSLHLLILQTRMRRYKNKMGTGLKHPFPPNQQLLQTRMRRYKNKMGTGLKHPFPPNQQLWHTL